MKLPSRPSISRQCGVPMDAQSKKNLRNRSVRLTNAQRHVLKQMGVRVDKNATEKQAVMLVKRVVNFESAYNKPGYISKWTRKCISNKPKSISKRQHYTNVLMYREESGSNRATKKLAKL